MNATKRVGVTFFSISEKTKSASLPAKLVLLICTSLVVCFANAQVITVKINFASAPTVAGCSFADLKYNKQSVFNLEIDDQPANVMSILAYLQGGVAPEDGVHYPGKYFTDGCGNNRPYTAAVAMTAHSNYNDGDLTLVPSLLSVAQLNALIAAGFTLENHGFYHEKDQYYLLNNFTEYRNILENTLFIYDKTGFVPRVWVTPSANTGYNPYVQQQGYLAATSQSVTDGYTPHPVNMWTDQLADLSELDSSFNVFLRGFTDDWANTATTDELKSRVTGLKNASTSGIHKLYRLGTHSFNSGNWSGFKSFMDHVDTVSHNTIWVTSLQELLEYFEVKRLASKTETLEGNVLTVNLDLSKVPVNNRFRDISLLINGDAAISSVSVSGADGFSYNDSGLVNIFKKKLVADPPYQRPVALAGPDKEVVLPDSTAVLNGTVLDTTMHMASYSWTKVFGPSGGTIEAPSSASTAVSGLTQGTYVFRLTVADTNGIRTSDEVNVNVIAIASEKSTVHLEAENWTSMSGVLTENTLDVGGGKNVGWIELGDWMEYSVNVASPGSYTLNLRIATPNSGAQLQIKNSSGALLSTVSLPTTGGWQSWQTISTTISLVQGAQTIRLQSSSSAGWNINWLEVVGASSSNQAPTVSAGTDKTITLPTNSVSLTGTASDPDGSIASYSWTKVSGGSATIGSPSSASTTISGLTQGSYVFRLTVTDNSGATASDQVSVTVNAAANQAPTVSAGVDQSITLPQNSVTLTGTASDADGSIAAYAWTKVSGGSATISSPSSASTTITGLVQGSYVFRLTVTDNQGAIASDDVSVTVNAAANQLPTVSAGADQSITLPTSSVSLSGTASDPDGTISSYSWTKVSGGSATISSPASASTTISGLVQGAYVFRLTVTDNSGATASDEVSVVVNPEPAPNFSLRIEAESFVSSSQVSKLPTQDAGGGQQVSSLDNGDWMQYALNIPYSATYTISFRISCTKGGSKLQLQNQSGTVLATLNLPNTGGTQNWQTVSVQASLSAGAQNLKLVVSKSSGNPSLNWWDITLSNATGGSNATTHPETAADSQTASPDSSFLAVYPNPVYDHFQVEVQNPFNGPLKFQLWSLAGVLQKEFAFSKTNLSEQTVLFIKDLPKGEYIVVALMDGWQERKKIIKL